MDKEYWDLQRDVSEVVKALSNLNDDVIYLCERQNAFEKAYGEWSHFITVTMIKHLCDKKHDLTDSFKGWVRGELRRKDSEMQEHIKSNMDSKEEILYSLKEKITSKQAIGKDYL